MHVHLSEIEILIIENIIAMETEAKLYRDGGEAEGTEGCGEAGFHLSN